MALTMTLHPLYHQRIHTSSCLIDAAFDEDATYTLLDHLELIDSKIQVLEESENRSTKDSPFRLISKLQSL